MNKQKFWTGLVLISLILGFNSCTRIYMIESPNNSNQALTSNNSNQALISKNHIRDLNQGNQSLYIYFLNPETKQIVKLDMDSNTPEDTVKFNGNISDYSKTYSKNFSFIIPKKAFLELQKPEKISETSFVLKLEKRDSLKANHVSNYFGLGLPAVVHSIENKYSDEGIIQTMNGIISTPMNSHIKFYGISDFVPLIIWGGALIVGAVITHLSIDGKSVPCDEITIRATENCDNKELRELALEHCDYDCIKESNGEFFVSKRK